MREVVKVFTQTTSGLTDHIGGVVDVSVNQSTIESRLYSGLEYHSSADIPNDSQQEQTDKTR